MTSINLLRCDQCGRTIDREAVYAEGWQHITTQTPLSFYLRPEKRENLPEADLCSWACLRDYALVQMLDPSPEPRV